MLEEFRKHLADNFSFLNGKRLLLAVSGGVDSMVMTHLLEQLDFEIALAHCNFQLRAEESVGDQHFIEDYAKDHQLTIFVTRFDTKAFAADHKLSTQVAARELRYGWFQELLETHNYDFLLTAHHADDNIETFIINLTRGSGLEGFTGIPAINGSVVRPLLAFSREDIHKYAQANDLAWREDSSNASDKYLRNKIRHDLVPILKELNPSFLDSFQKTQQYLQDAQTLVEDASVLVYKQVVQEKEDELHFNLNQLKRLPNYKSYLYQWLNGLGFKAWDDIYNLVESQSGKQVFAENYRLLKDREFLILSKKTTETGIEEYLISKNQTEISVPVKMSLTKVNALSNVSNMSIFADQDKLQFPLTLRKWKEGDLFQPFGMGGKSKKVSKFFKDEKLSLIEKEQTWLLCSGSQIVWIVGLRQDERFKVDNTTKNIIQLTFIK